MEKETTIARAKELRQSDDLEESQELLLALLEQHPNDPVVLFEVGGSYDVLGLEPEAIPYYRKAIDKGLRGSDLQECLVCLGSSYRVVGNHQESVEVLEDAVDRFPDDNSGRAFLALAYYSNEQYQESVKLLLELLLTTTKDEEILSYAEPLDYYKDNLDEEWEE